VRYFALSRILKELCAHHAHQQVVEGVEAVFAIDKLSQRKGRAGAERLAVVFFAVEIEKWLVRRGWIYRMS